METRILGQTGIAVPRLGLGCATFGREIDESASFALMDYAVEHGMNLFDTAEAYGGGQARDYRKSALGVDDIREVGGAHHSSEKIIGAWLRSRGARDRIVLVSKITANFTRGHMREALAASLDRLQTDYLDVYMFHSFDPHTPLEEALEGMREAQDSGLIRCAGCSNFTTLQLRDALDQTRGSGFRLEAVEAICNLAARGAETDLLPLCRQEQVAFIGYSPLGAGFLTGKYSADRNAFPSGSRFHVIPGHADIYFSEENFATVERLRDIAERSGIPAVRIAVAWVLAHPDVTTVLCGARRIGHLENALAAERLLLTQEWRDLDAHL